MQIRGKTLQLNRMSKILVFALAVVLLSGSLERDAYAISLSSITSESIREKEGQISEAQKQKKNLQSGLTDVKAMKQQLEKTKNDLESYVTTLDANLEEVQAKIEELKGLIADKEAEIEETEAELAAAIERQDAQYAAMKERIKFNYESKRTQYIEILVSANSFGDILNRLDYIQNMADYDDQKLQEYKLTREFIEACKAQLDAEKEVLDEAKAEVETEEDNLQDLIGTKEAEIVKYQGDIANKTQAIAEYEADIAAQNEIIQALEAAVAAERKRLAAESGKRLTYDGGMFCFPAPSYTRISDDYGNRIHPTLGVQQFHNGVDLAAPNGSAILAAYDGEVVAASYSASMGNYIMIDHGGSLYTIYMHASALYVNKGDLVSKGQKIAAVGSTGRSTGPHLHFSVRQNGSYVSPWNFLK